MKKKELLKKLMEALPADASVSSICFEGSNLVVYTTNKQFLIKGKEAVVELVKQWKKRIDVRLDPKLLMEEGEAEDWIRKLLPSEVGISYIWFEPKRSKVLVEVDKPGLAIGRGGEVVNQVKQLTGWSMEVRRAPAIKSRFTRGIRAALFKHSDFRRNFLNAVGEKIYRDWERKLDYKIRLSCLGGFREVGRSCMLLLTDESRVLIDCGINIATKAQAFPFFDLPEFNVNQLDAVIISHAHLDHCAALPLLYRYGYEGPCYMTAPTRDLTALLQIDYIDVLMRDAEKPPYKSAQIREAIKRSIALDYGEVTDIAPDVRLTFFDAGHVLGSALVHLNIGDGHHNLLYTGDLKFSPTKLFKGAHSTFQRVETLIMEATYGGREDVQPSRKECEQFLVQIAKQTIERGGKVLIPVLAVGRAQEAMLIIGDAMERGEINAPIWVDGMIWDINAIHTAYPEFMREEMEERMKVENPFSKKYFKRIGSVAERQKVIEGEPCVILATSGMLTGGPAVFYFKELAGEKRNSLVFVSYQAEGSLGRRIQKGEIEVPVESMGKRELVRVEMEVYSIDGLSGHSDRNELLSFVRQMRPRPKRAIICHGEASKCIELASAIHKSFRIETNVPRCCDALRLK